ncbi:MAG: HNH endonuclease [Bacillota bacterium]
MPKKRMPFEVWAKNIRPVIWSRDGQRCVRCKKPLKLLECHIDHIKSGKLGTNKYANLRTLCRVCHVLRADFRHNGMIARALEDEIIPPNWREFVWEE